MDRLTARLLDDALAKFTEYFVANYPGPHTIIHDPKWHAPKIFRAAQLALDAVNLQSLSQEAVREEALEEAARVCDIEAASRRYRQDHPLPGDTDMMIQGHKAVTAGTCATAIRALKREPNAAGQASGAWKQCAECGAPTKCCRLQSCQLAALRRAPDFDKLHLQLTEIRATLDAIETQHDERPPSGEMVRHHVIQAAYRPRPMCRDCADRDGTCYDGTKCDPFEAALDLLREAGGDVQSWAAEYTKKLTDAQSRIAELEAGRDFQSARIDGIIKEESMAQNVLKKRCKEFEKLLCDAQENLVWCGGSTDFGWGGKAQVGYDKGPRATIAAIDAALQGRIDK